MAVPGPRLAPIAIALITGVLASRVDAQSPNDRADIERWRDSLAATSDSVGLLAVEKQHIELAKRDRNNAVVHLKLGFLSLRHGELGGQSQ